MRREQDMLDSILQQFASGDSSGLPHEQAVSHVSRMLEQAPQEHALGALSDAVTGMDSGTFGNSVTSAAQNLGPEQRGQLGSLLQSVMGGGGAGNPSDLSPQELGSLATQAHQTNPSGLVGMLGSALSGGNLGGMSLGGLGGAGGGGFSTGSGSGLLSLLGNPMVRQVGMNLAQRMLSGGRSSL